MKHFFLIVCSNSNMFWFWFVLILLTGRTPRKSTALLCDSYFQIELQILQSCWSHWEAVGELSLLIHWVPLRASTYCWKPLPKGGLSSKVISMKSRESSSGEATSPSSETRGRWSHIPSIRAPYMTPCLTCMCHHSVVQPASFRGMLAKLHRH